MRGKRQHKIKNAKCAWLDKEIDKGASNGRSFFSVTKSILKPRSELDLEHADCDGIVKHFSSIAGNKWNWNTPIDFTERPNTINKLQNISETKIIRVVKSIRLKSSVGSNDIFQ